METMQVKSGQRFPIKQGEIVAVQKNGTVASVKKSPPKVWNMERAAYNNEVDECHRPTEKRLARIVISPNTVLQLLLDLSSGKELSMRTLLPKDTKIVRYYQSWKNETVLVVESASFELVKPSFLIPELAFTITVKQDNRPYEETPSGLIIPKAGANMKV